MFFKGSNKVPPAYIGNEDKSDTAVLFVHGLNGSYLTWYEFSSHLKDTWKEVDSFNLEYDEYYSAQGFWVKIPFMRKLRKFRRILIGPDINNLAEHFRTAVDELCRDYANVIIIAHSMGGLIARKYILNLLVDTKKVGKIRALITYATPHHGSILANYYKILSSTIPSWILKATNQITQLQKDEIFIKSLNTEWSVYRVEDKLDFFRVVGLEDAVVDQESSSFMNNLNVKVIAHKNHSNIIIPHGKRDLAFLVTYNYLKDFRNSLLLKIEKEMDRGLDENRY